ncbi:hypothetical protein SDC9_59355 [bioreactor metagenome]|uniref:Uncharacterized protein n=1 Tax=bioreactor metagenome TaxID=1076179 RepID=A0A644XA09_9ZZZZ
MERTCFFGQATRCHRWPAQRRQIHAFQQAGGKAAFHRGGYPRRDPRPALRRVRVAQPEIRPGGYRRYRALRRQRNFNLHAQTDGNCHSERHRDYLCLRRKNGTHRLRRGGGEDPSALPPPGGAGRQQDGPHRPHRS